MKIPETGNVGAYYGNEENGQWQPNGVIIDNGVGGGVVGSGDAGVLRPPGPVYPVHMPRGAPMTGYVMAGAFYPPAYPAAGPAMTPHDDFADYMWMENEDEFDKQVMQQLEEEALMEQCIEAMLEDEQREKHRRTNGHNNNGPTTSNGANSASLQEAVSRSTLNPLAAEFVPGRVRQPPEEISDTPESKDSVQQQPNVQAPSETVNSSETDVKIDDKESPPQSDPPEVSAADVQPIEDTDKKSKEKPKIKSDIKKTTKPEVKAKVKTDSKVKKDPKVKSVQSEVKTVLSEVKSVKSEVKCVQSEVKSVKSEEEKEDSIEVVKQSSPPPTDEPSSGIKPINYAAAAKANKPKKATTPPATDKITPPPVKTEKPKEKNPPKTTTPKVKSEKTAVKVDKPVQRKNSAK